MSVFIDECRTNLINRILFARSQEDVKRCIEAGMLAFDANKVHGYIISRFVEKIISELELYSAMKKDAQPWSNITLARVPFNRIKHQFITIVN